MAFDPIITNYVGMLPFLTAAKAIIESDFVDALAWRCALDGSTPGSNFAAVQFSHMHSQDYPLLVIQPAASNPTLNASGGLNQAHIFDVEIFVTKAIAAGDPITQTNEHTAELVRYLDATMWAFMCATDAQWRADFPASLAEAKTGQIRAFATDVVFGQLFKGTEQETAGMYERSVAFELQISMLEVEG